MLVDMTDALWSPINELAKRLGVSRQAVGAIAARYGLTIIKYESRLWVPSAQIEVVVPAYLNRANARSGEVLTLPVSPPGLFDWVSVPTLAKRAGLGRMMGSELVERFHGRTVAAHGTTWVTTGEADRILAQYQSWRQDRQLGLTTGDVALMLGRSKSTVHAQRRNGRLKATWDGRAWIYDKDSVKAYRGALRS